MFKPGEMIKHISCLDLVMEIVKRQYFGEKYGVYRVRWYNPLYGVYLFSSPETVRVMHADIRKWKVWKDAHGV